LHLADHHHRCTWGLALEILAFPCILLVPCHRRLPPFGVETVLETIALSRTTRAENADAREIDGEIEMIETVDHPHLQDMSFPMIEMVDPRHTTTFTTLNISYHLHVPRITSIMFSRILMRKFWKTSSVHKVIFVMSIVSGNPAQGFIRNTNKIKASLYVLTNHCSRCNFLVRDF
jgi:hypothetical protein